MTRWPWAALAVMAVAVAVRLARAAAFDRAVEDDGLCDEGEEDCA